MVRLPCPSRTPANHAPTRCSTLSHLSPLKGVADVTGVTDLLMFEGLIWVLQRAPGFINDNAYTSQKYVFRLPRMLTTLLRGPSCFDFEYYKKRSKDLQALPKSHLWPHFINDGQFEGRPFRWGTHWPCIFQMWRSGSSLFRPAGFPRLLLASLVGLHYQQVLGERGGLFFWKEGHTV